MVINRQYGFNLIEALMVLAILGVVVSLAYPSFESSIRLNKVQSQATKVMNTLLIARSEAIKSGQRTVVCKSSNKVTCTTGGFWESGWIIFRSINGDDVLDPGDVIISVSSPVAPDISIRGGSFNLNTIGYRPDGTTGLLVANPQTLTFKICYKMKNNLSRQVYIDASGRPRVETKGVTGTCLTAP